MFSEFLSMKLETRQNDEFRKSTANHKCKNYIFF